MERAAPVSGPLHGDADEEIDEEEAFDEADYEMWGDVGGPAGGSGAGAGGSGDEAASGGGGGGGGGGGEADSEDDDDDDDDMITLEEMLDQRIAQEEDESRRKAVRGEGGEGAEHDGEEPADDHERLLDSVLGPDRRRARQPVVEQTHFGQESQHSVGGAELSFSSLVGSLGDLGSEGLQRRASSAPASRANAPLAPSLSREQVQRVERGEAYKATAKDVTRWQPTVKANREAEHIYLSREAVDGRQNASNAALAAKFQPTTELELEVDAILRDNGMEEAEVRNGEDLEMNSLSVEEVAERQAQLRQMRYAMFQQEFKNRRLKKIKSRKFRKIQKKERMKNAASAEEVSALDGDAAEEASFVEERGRAQERMSLRHRNSSKWIQRQLRSNPASQDAETRQAIAEQLRIGNKLRKKVDRVEGAADPQGEQVGTDSEDERFIEQTRKQESSGLWGELDAGSSKPAESASGLLGMKFMQRATARQQQTTGVLLEELDSDGDGEGAEASRASTGRKTFGAQSEKSLSEELGGDNDSIPEMSFSSQPSRTSQSAVTGAVPVDVPKAFAAAAVAAGAAPNASASAPTSAEENPWIGEARAKHKGRHAANSVSDAQIDLKPISAPARETAGGAVVSHDELIQRAFVTGGATEEDFVAEKALEVSREAAAKLDVPVVLPGWGAWGGKGAKKSKLPKFAQEALRRPNRPAKRRADAAMSHVIINEKRNKKSAKFQATADQLPYQFKREGGQARNLYEGSMRMPLGKEWTTHETHKKRIAPRIVTKMGTIIAPIKMSSASKSSKRRALGL